MILLTKHLWSLIIYSFVVSTYHRVCRRVSANCWAGLCVLERRQPGWSGEVVLRVPGYGGPDGTTAQEEMPASDTEPCSFRETKGETLWGLHLFWVLGHWNSQAWDSTSVLTELCVRVPAPEGRACCRKTVAEIVSGESGASACSRRTLLPRGPLLLLHKDRH